MNPGTAVIRHWLAACLHAWDRFWFTPAQPHTLALIRILAGGMLFYTHLVWAFDLDAFLGPHSWVTADVSRELSRDGYAWSYLWYVDSRALLWVLHGLALLAFAMLTLGLVTRVAAVLAWLTTVAYCHRLTGALFGLDQVNAMLAMYLAVGPQRGCVFVGPLAEAGQGRGARGGCQHRGEYRYPLDSVALTPDETTNDTNQDIPFVGVGSLAGMGQGRGG